jgi:SAM-dependent methyltransferase
VSHFDSIADTYDEQIPEHVRRHLLRKKSACMQNYLQQNGITNARGVDLGCGTGHYLAAITAHGHEMSGLEYSKGMAAQARQNTAGLDIEVEVGSITDTPYPDRSFDFAYMINVLHHLPDAAAQVRAIEEAGRILRPGGAFFLQDIYCDNFLFRFYMDRIFPLTNAIDDDDQDNWISLKWLKGQSFQGLELDQVRFFTFLPNCVPRLIFPLAARIELFLERTTRGRLGAHYMAVFRRT